MQIVIKFLIQKKQEKEKLSLVTITDTNGNAITSQNLIANVNPIRCRGYYFDLEK